jgi:hypothetical protein
VGPITQTGDLALKTEDGSCTIDAASSNGGYVKTSTTYRMHITAQVTGRCQWRNYNFGVCTDGISYTRTIGTTWQYVDYPTFVGSVQVNPSNTTTIQNYSTIGPVNTLSSGAAWGSSVEGPHVYTTSTNANATSCNITPTSFPQNQALTINVLKCEPNYWVNNDHLATPGGGDKVKIYLPGTLSALGSALDFAIDAWNSALVLTGLQLERVGSPCNYGPACVVVTPGNVGSLCGQTSSDYPLGSGGVIQGGGTIKVSNTGSSNWTGWTTAGGRRTFIHEIGHLLGMDNYSHSCGVNDAMMQPEFYCADANNLPSTSIAPDDSIPIVNSVHNGNTKKKCGF